MRVPLEMLIDDLHTIQQNYFTIETVLLRARREDVFALEYEELGQPAMMRRLLQFLDLPPELIETTLQNTAGTARNDELRFARGPTPAQRIQNYDEIRALLRLSRYQRWVEA